jgi:hypothetical protein
MGTARSGRSQGLTPERARQNLIKAGCYPALLDTLLEPYKRVQQGNYIAPTTWDECVRGQKPYVRKLAKRLETLADDFQRVWTEKGKKFLILSGQHKFTASLPLHLRAGAAILAGALNDVGKKCPTVKMAVKLELIVRVKDVTGGWHDAELAALCGDTTGNWKTWRMTWLKSAPAGPAKSKSALTPPHGS